MKIVQERTRCAVDNAVDARASESRCAGFTLIEIMIAVMVFALVSVVLLQHLTISYSSTRQQRERVFAYMKCQSILAEMNALVDSTDDTAAIALDEFDDGASMNPVLTTDTVLGLPVSADDPVSGNRATSDGWEWYRQISVRPFASLDNRSVRYVTVRVFNRDQEEIASLSSVVNSVSASYPTTQVYDVYMLAIENIPGWWVYMENIVPAMEAAVADLENRNPGLELRTHWITKASYGRNQQYKPFINEVNDSNQIVPFAYYYPGSMPLGSSSSYYYVPSAIRGRMTMDNLEINGYDATKNPYPYALADFYNHAMRLPKERELHALRIQEVQARKAAIEAAKTAGMMPPEELDDMSDEPTLRLLLEDMNTNPDKYRHALLVNLHGELIPMPSIRNYSDPAKSSVYPGMRAVTHPEEIRTFRKASDPKNSDDVHLRVYAWSAQPGNYFTYPEPTATYIMLDIMDVDLRDKIQSTTYNWIDSFGDPQTSTVYYYPFHPDGWVRAMYGGVTYNGSKEYPTVGMTDPAFPSAKAYYEAPYPWPAGKPMRYYMYFGQLASGRRFTRIYLLYTPLRCDVVTNTTTGAVQGLFNNQRSRLYGLEYNPAPTGDKTFDRDLAADGDGPKNTARWRIKIPAKILSESSRWYNEDGTPSGSKPSGDVRLTFRTFIHDGSTPWPEQPGVMYPTPMQPDNLSETYTWWAATRDAVPATERAQFLGDPRFNPYKDLLNGDLDFGDGYNWFFDSFDATVAADFPGIVRRYERWDNLMRQDVPRFFELLRNGLVKSNAIYTTLTGYSYYYMGHGNEIGYDSANGYPSSIPTQLRPFGDPADGTGYVNNITGFRRYVRDSRTATDYWWGMPWLGELYPDNTVGQWQTNGNLLAGNTGLVTTFYRQRDADCVNNNTKFSAYGTTLSSAQQRAQSKGCVSFMNNGSSTSHFNHETSGANATLVGSGLELQTKYNFPLPSTIYSNRPFVLNTGGNVPPEFNLAPYSTNRHTATLLQKYYDRGTPTGSGLVQLEDATNTDAAFIVVSGLAPSTTLGASFIGKFSVLAMLQSYFEAGVLATSHRIKQTPRVEVKSPDELTELKNPTTITVLWDTSWVRWDGEAYTGSAPTVVESETDIEYSLMYSKDNGKTWRQLQNTAGTLTDTGVDATPGQRPANPAHLTLDGGFGQDSRVWSVPALTYPQGSYLLRIEAYRQNQSLHYSHHTQRFFIDR